MKNLIYLLLAMLLSCSPKPTNSGKQMEKTQVTFDSVSAPLGTIKPLNDRLAHIAKSKDDTLSREERVLIFIENFYNEYLPSIYDRTSYAVKLEYCTPELIEQLSESTLDVDPFINAQDFDDNLLKTLTITEDTTQENKYIVSYIGSYSKRKISILLEIKMVENSFKINNTVPLN